MMNTATLTQKGQVTIPRYIRKALRIDKDSKLLVRLDEQHQRVILEPIADLLSLAGSLRSDVVLTDEELKQARAAAWGSRTK